MHLNTFKVNIMTCYCQPNRAQSGTVQGQVFFKHDVSVL